MLVFENLTIYRAYRKLSPVKGLGSAYAAMGERELEKHCSESPWEEVIEAVRERKREVGFHGEMLQGAGVSAGLPEEVSLFLEEVLEGYPDQDIRLLAAARRRERSKEGREELIRAMRELL